MWHENINLDYFEFFCSTLNVVLEASTSPFPQPSCAEIPSPSPQMQAVLRDLEVTCTAQGWPAVLLSI